METSPLLLSHAGVKGQMSHIGTEMGRAREGQRSVWVSPRQGTPGGSPSAEGGEEEEASPNPCANRSYSPDLRLQQARLHPE